MNGRLRQRIAIRQTALRVVASLLVVACLFTLNPTPAPAADQSDATAPVTFTIDSDPVPVDDPECAADDSGALATDIPVTEAGVVACQETASETVDPGATASPTPEPIATPTGDRSSDGAPVAEPSSEISATPDVSETVGQPVDGASGEEDKGSNEDVPPVDPSLVDPPGDEVTPVDDPMPVDFVSPEVTAEPFVDPPLDGFTSDAAAASTDNVVSAAAANDAKKPKAGVTVDAISADGTVISGGQTSYLFLVVNTGKNTEHFWFDTVTTGTGWTTSIFTEDGSTVLTERQTLKGGQEMRVLVVVTAPWDALAGDVVTTTVTAVDSNGKN